MPDEPYYVSKKDTPLNQDPLLSYQFMLELGGMVAGYFTECSGIVSENEVVDHKVVDDQGHSITRKIPGRMTWGELTLKRGITTDMQLWDWRQLVVEGKTTDSRKNITITMFDRTYAPAAKWNFANAWPSKVSGPELKADSTDFGVEELTIVHEGMWRAAV